MCFVEKSNANTHRQKSLKKKLYIFNHGSFGHCLHVDTGIIALQCVGSCVLCSFVSASSDDLSLAESRILFLAHHMHADSLDHLISLFSHQLLLHPLIYLSKSELQRSCFAFFRPTSPLHPQEHRNVNDPTQTLS